MYACLVTYGACGDWLAAMPFGLKGGNNVARGKRRLPVGSVERRPW